MSNPLRFIFDQLTERLFGILVSNAGNAASACRAASEAQQQSLLEDLARHYESEGKQAIADRLRAQASGIECSDPAGEGAVVLGHLGSGATTPILPGIPPEKLASQKKTRSKRRSRRSVETAVESSLEKDAEKSAEGELGNG